MEEGIGAKGREEGIKGAEGRLGEDEDENGEDRTGVEVSIRAEGTSKEGKEEKRRKKKEWVMEKSLRKGKVKFIRTAVLLQKVCDTNLLDKKKRFRLKKHVTALRKLIYGDGGKRSKRQRTSD